ncbi:TetR/AcrR family transcriptional regulator [Sphaerisporangium aureirubrum]|uniref:TetR/AcrR family transcriptional regulator n=1 Tax=Sphaerisporangium aureirubrum TaxID=1544736 RepID=A0ABW1NH11_9ACTN
MEGISAPADDVRSGRDRRAGLILDTAAELLVAWGYRRVTIDEVARRAGVGKGTVYLHFSTKEVLFLTVLMRSQRQMIARILQACREDPWAIRFGDLARLAYLAVHDDPIVRAMLVGDAETLGALLRTAPSVAGGLMEVRERAMGGYVRVLREHGLVRTDLPAELQRHSYAAIMTGFLVFEPFRTGTADVAERADALRGIVRSSFETDAPAEAVRAAAPAAIALFQEFHDRLHLEIEKHTLP